MDLSFHFATVQSTLPSEAVSARFPSASSKKKRRTNVTISNDPITKTQCHDF